MDLDLMLFRAFAAFSALFALAFVVQRARYKRGRSKKKSNFGFFPSAAMLGNALQSLQVFAQPHVKHVLLEKLHETAEDDDQGDPDDPSVQLNRQLRQIRNGEYVDALKVPLTKPRKN